MSITPKNWGEFQHYKDRSPAWIKLHRGLLDNFDYHRLPVASRALAPMLWLLASEYEDGVITASMEEMAFRFRVSPAELRSAIKPLIDSGFFLDSEALADCKRDASLEKEGEKRREERDARADDWPSDFREKFWAEYPHRVGKSAAIQKLEAVRKRGVEWALVMGGLRTYVRTKPKDRQWCNPATWLHQDRWLDQPADASPAFVPSERQTPEQAVAQFAKLGSWSRHSPFTDVSQVPVELLTKHGLLPDGRKIASQGH
ncbi:hypothetical protein JQ628_11415 [Bradyrhizobium lablabi]|uniref:hypothetical protein n=1 Tax=Bradyrhizobium lablabi TaxID=722472 RepID=UPI001BA70507|nr:hypothetical protein [Bradyrhizobium lablabi]MBR1122124.1 hypothetical protein [Bradyrhizobium lablabi]